ncbi:SMI1/KNR4 family protein [Streptomyces sp. NPDC006365]|uniref:SMI1/KNR4 family protein n=1 Tax=Streptomyces sp. NPDC006365 TaxID=3364744 RepID=UPI003681899C
MTVEGAWERIEAWLRSNAPASYASLPEAADPVAIRAAEDALGFPLPEELVTLLSRHDGGGEFVLPVAHRLSGVRMIGDEYPRSREIFSSWDPGWVPFAYDECGNSLFVSRRDDETFRRVGVYEKDGGGSFGRHPAFTSVTALLECVAQALDDGILDIWGEWEPVADDEGFLDWREPEADGEVIRTWRK